MPATTSSTPQDPLQETMERHLGADVRFLYGLAVPFLLATALIVVGVLAGGTWVVPVLVVILIALTGLVLREISRVLDEDR